MGQFEYLLLLASVILGLAVSDLAVSLNRLLDAGARIKWDWLSPLAALVAFLEIVTQWWSWFAAAPIAKAITFEMYLGVLVSAVLLFLLAAAALPDAFGEAQVDLRAYYARIQRRFWLLFAAHFVAANGVSAWIQVQAEGAKFTQFSPYYLLAPVVIALAFFRQRWLHALCLVGLVALYIAQLAGHGLGR